MADMLTILAANCIKNGANLIAKGSFAITPTDANDQPSPVRAGSGGPQILAEASIVAIANGSIVGTLQFPNPAVSSPRNVKARIEITDNTTLHPVVTTYAGVDLVDNGSGQWDFASYDAGLVTTSIPRTVQLAPGIIQGSGLVVEGDSIPSGYGSGTPYASIMVANNSNFKGRVSYHNVATAGYSIDQMASRYVATVKPYILAAVAAGVPCHVVLDGGSNSLATETQTASATYTQALAYWAQVIADGGTMYACTIRQRKGAITWQQREQIELYNDMVRNAPAGSYHVLLDWDRALENPLDAAAFNSDALHTTYGADRAQAGMLATAILNGAVSTLVSKRAVGDTNATVHTGGASPFSVDLYQDTVLSESGTSVVTVAEASRQGKKLRIVHAGGACYVQATASGQTINGLSVSPTLATVGDSMDLQLDGTDWKITRLASAPPRQFGAVRVQASATVLATDDILDVSGAGFVFDGSQNYKPGHKVTLVNSGSSTASAIISSTKVNGTTSGTPFTLAQYKTTVAAYISSSTGWIVPTPA